MNSKDTQEQIILEVLNPRGVLKTVPISGLKNPRVPDLNGKRIALLSEKTESVHFFNALEELLKEKYPTSTILRFDSPANPTRPDNTAEVAVQCDVWLQGVKTSGASVVDYDVKLEQHGKPGASFCIDSLLGQRKRQAEVNGIPTLRIISIPAVTFMSAEGYSERMKPVAASVLEATIKALTTPLTEAEKNPSTPIFDYGPLKFAGNSYTEATEKFQQYCADNTISDGLPVVPPSREAVDWMLKGTSRPPEEEIGVMAPRNGMATIEKIAINAVMAGARPEYLPVIITAIECVTDMSFNLYHLVNSAGSPTPIIWVNGPIAKEIGMNSGMGFLGRGCRANSSIGRAAGLCMLNIGWQDIFSGLTGDPKGYCNFIFPENEKDSPWESFAVEHGFTPEESTVTVNETMQFMRGPGSGMFSRTKEECLDRIAELILIMGNPLRNSMFPSANRRYEIVLHPSFARQLAEAGFTKHSIVQWFYEKTCIKWEQLSEDQKDFLKDAAASGSFRGIKPEDCKPGLFLPCFSDPQNVAILVAGDAAGYTMVWSSPVSSTTLQPDSPSGAVDVPFMTKVIHGANLTKAGK